MKKALFCLSLIGSLIVSPAFAEKSVKSLESTNTCVKNMPLHSFFSILDLSDCHIQDKDVPAVVTYLSSKLSNFAYLYLNGNNIGPEGAKLLAQANLPAYVTLDDNHIGTQGAIALAKNASIHELLVGGNYIGAPGIIALAKDNNLQVLDVGNNDLNTQSIVALAANRSIKLLGIDQTYFDDLGKAALINNTTIQGLDVSYSNLNGYDIQAILGTNKHDITYLRVAGLHLNDDDAQIIARIAPTLSALDISDNNLGPAGAMALSKLPVEALWLKRNNIGDQGIAALATQFYSILDVSQNGIGDAGAFSLANNTNGIYFLDISLNSIDQAGMDALKNNPKIYTIDDQDTELKQTSMITNLCQKNPLANCKKLLGSYLSKIHKLAVKS